MLRQRQMITGLVVAVITALLLSACGVTRGDETQEFHRLRMMVPNSPGGGYDLTARTAVVPRSSRKGSRCRLALRPRTNWIATSS